MFKKLNKILELEISLLEHKLQEINKNNFVRQWNLETGERFNDLINKYPISEEELLSISETVAKFVAITRITNIDKYLFEDDKLEMPRRINSFK